MSLRGRSLTQRQRDKLRRMGTALSANAASSGAVRYETARAAVGRGWLSLSYEAKEEAVAIVGAAGGLGILILAGSSKERA